MSYESIFILAVFTAFNGDLCRRAWARTGISDHQGFMNCGRIPCPPVPARTRWGSHTTSKQQVSQDCRTAQIISVYRRYPFLPRTPRRIPAEPRRNRFVVISKMRHHQADRHIDPMLRVAIDWKCL